MILSIVTGTVNRPDMLKRMMQSVRDQMPMHIPYEFVVITLHDDPSLPWLRSQADVQIIEQRGLTGAINAFTLAARQARGQYVVMANDDITFHPNSLLAALAYLEENATCGAVAFADNRSAQLYEHINAHQVESMGAVSVDGLLISVPYAQVGMFRRWLGEAVGWWGADDPIMRKSRTYGGDNYLSARIWERGYSVDPVKGCAIDDHIANDSLRAINGARGNQDSAAYYERYPQGPQLQMRPANAQPHTPQLRVLYLPVHEGRGSEYGMGEALAQVGLVYEYDYLRTAHLESELTGIVKTFRPHLLITQIQGPGDLDGELLARLRRFNPEMVIVNWNGDAHMAGLVDPKVLSILREVDLQTCINAQAFAVYRAECIPHAYWQIGFKDPITDVRMPAHQVLFQGNCYNEARNVLVGQLKTIRAQGVNVGVYGHCPGANGYTHNDYARSTALIKAADIVIGDTFDPANTIGFVSNRVFQTLAAGGFLLQQASTDLESHTGLIAGEHYAEWKTPGDLPDLIRFYLNRPDERARMAQAGQAFVREHFSYDAQVRKLFNVLLPELIA